MFRTLLPGTLGVALLLAAGQAHAHATFETQKAPSGGTYKAVLRVPHGCDGEATHTVRIRMPEGIIAVKPMPKPGWALSTTTGTYAQSYDYYGTPTSEGVQEIIWSGGALPDAWYDEFVFRGYVTDLPADSVLAFPTVQSCANGEVAWDEIAAAGQDPHALEYPAPTVTIVAQDGHGHGHAAAVPTFTVGDLVIESPWARESVTSSGAAYLTVRNNGDQDDRLIAVTSAVADRSELHSSTMEGGVMKMHPVEAVLVPAHGESALTPGGLHLMLMGLNGRLEEGKSFALTLEFEHAGTIEVMATIEDIAHGGGGAHNH